MDVLKQTSLEMKQGELLARHCRFEVGGHADYFCEVTNADQLTEALKFAEDKKLRYFVYAGGSNIFFDDTGFRGLVIRYVNGDYSLDKDSLVVTVSAGYELPILVRELAGHDCGGIEFLGNIPGSIGGAIVGNAGCYGQNIAGVLVSAEIMKVDTREVKEVDPGFFKFAYRHSQLKDDPSIVVTAAKLQLTSRPCSEVLTQVEEELEVRITKHPHEAPCAGSFFKNESRDHPAWLLITEAGMAEARVGGAGISGKHANFLVNQHGATSRDIIQLTKKIQKAVWDNGGWELVPEVRYVSPFGISRIGK